VRGTRGRGCSAGVFYPKRLLAALDNAGGGEAASEQEAGGGGNRPMWAGKAGSRWYRSGMVPLWGSFSDCLVARKCGEGEKRGEIGRKEEFSASE